MRNLCKVVQVAAPPSAAKGSHKRKGTSSSSQAPALRTPPGGAKEGANRDVVLSSSSSSSRARTDGSSYGAREALTSFSVVLAAAVQLQLRARTPVIWRREGRRRPRPVG